MKLDKRISITTIFLLLGTGTLLFYFYAHYNAVALHKKSTIVLKTGTVRVAAIQCFSEMGNTYVNLRKITRFVRLAAKKGAKIVVTPECAVQGYCYPPTWKMWVDGPGSKEENTLSINAFAETVDGKSIQTLARLADELNIYLCVGFAERANGKFYNAQVLLSPDGKTIGHHRKKDLWMQGDGWCTEGDLPIQAIKTEYGVLGMMICFDFHSVTQLLDKAGADIILYSVGWYGPNEKNWFTFRFPRDFVVPYKHHIVLSNWCGMYLDDEWVGRGFSSVIQDDGNVLNINENPLKEGIVIADLPLHKK
jgi:predicted amidohydrolase